MGQKMNSHAINAQMDSATWVFSFLEDPQKISLKDFFTLCKH